MKTTSADTLRWWLLVLLGLCLTAVLGPIVCRGEAPVPQFVPIPHFADSPDPMGADTETVPTVLPLAPRADEPRQSQDQPAPQVRGTWQAQPVEIEKGGAAIAPPSPALQLPLKILRWERQCGPNGCQLVPVYSEDSSQSDEVVTQAARKLERWRDLPPEEAKRLAAIVDAPAMAKAIRQEYDIASCGMVCASHGSKLYDVFEDGTVQLAKEQPASGENQGYRGVRLFRRRR